MARVPSGQTIKEKSNDPCVVTNIRLPVALLRRTRRLAAQQGMSFSSLVRTLLAAYTLQSNVRGKASVPTTHPTAQREKEPLMTPVSAISFRQHMFELFERAIRTGKPVIIYYTPRRGIKGTPKTVWYKVEPIPESRAHS
jgi:hypothetical protein